MTLKPTRVQLCQYVRWTYASRLQSLRCARVCHTCDSFSEIPKWCQGRSCERRRRSSQACMKPSASLGLLRKIVNAAVKALRFCFAHTSPGCRRDCSSLLVRVSTCLCCASVGRQALRVEISVHGSSQLACDVAVLRHADHRRLASSSRRVCLTSRLCLTGRHALLITWSNRTTDS